MEKYVAQGSLAAIFAYGGSWTPSIAVSLFLLISLGLGVTAEKALPSSPLKVAEHSDKEDRLLEELCFHGCLTIFMGDLFLESALHIAHR